MVLFAHCQAEYEKSSMVVQVTEQMLMMQEYFQQALCWSGWRALASGLSVIADTLSACMLTLSGQQVSDVLMQRSLL